MSQKILTAISKIDKDKLYEIRLRRNFPVKVNFEGEVKYLSENGLTGFRTNAIVATEEDISDIIFNVTENSLYAFNDRIVNGFLTTADGVRIGVAGECVGNDGKVITVKNFSSLNIRIPHNVTGAADKVFKYVCKDDLILNTLIVSPPFFGKTTILKDLSLKIDKSFNYSVLLVDERGEFEKVFGENIDKITYSDKKYAFNAGIRSMSPDVIITDELVGEADWQSVKTVALSGVKIIATCHGKSLSDVRRKSVFIDNVFERYVVLKSDGLPGIIDKVYDGECKEL